MTASSAARPSLLTTATHFVFLGTICSISFHYYAYKQWQLWWEKPKRKALASGPHDAAASGRKKVIVITGCDRGFGRMLAESLKETNNFLVVALTLTAEAAAELLQEKETSTTSSSKNKGSPLKAVQCDVTKEKEIVQMTQFVDKLCRESNAVLYAIVNNAGIADPGDFLFDADLSTYKTVMNINFFGMLNVTQALLPLMIKTSKENTEGARIINLSSIGGAVATPSNGAYNASKFAVEAWSDTLRLELEPFNVVVSKIRPGPIKTQIQNDFQTNFINNFDAAPSPIKDLYGGEEFRSKILSVFQSMDPKQMGDPALVVETLKDMLTMPKHKVKPHYWVGADANTYWKALTILPTSVSDTIKRNFFRFSPIESAT